MLFVWGRDVEGCVCWHMRAQLLEHWFRLAHSVLPHRHPIPRAPRISLSDEGRQPLHVDQSPLKQPLLARHARCRPRTGGILGGALRRSRPDARGFRPPDRVLRAHGTAAEV